MHIGNGIICPITGIPMLAVATFGISYAFRKAKNSFSKDKILPTITLSGLVFALQMINFSIPQTGSSGHIIGAILLSCLLGKNIAFLSMCCILLIQSLFFNDGALLALGCNIFNMGILACYVAYPLFCETLQKKNKPYLAIILSSVVALQLGSIGVAIESVLSGSIAYSAITNFIALSQTIHLPIGIIEGFLSGTIIFISKKINIKKLSYGFGIFSLFLAGFIFQFGSNKPDGLEWSLLNISDSIIPQTQNTLLNLSQTIQNNLSSFFNIPNYLENIIGLFTVMFVMYLTCLFLNMKNEK